MSNAVKILPHYTYSDYEKWEGNWELIDGIPYAMSPAPVPKHQRIAGNLHFEFKLNLKGCDKCTVYQPLDYLIQDDTIFQPDMLIICKKITKKYLDFPPDLVVEVLSPATAAKDRFTKFPVYESQGIPYYLIVDPDMEEVEVYEIVKQKYKLIKRGKDITHGFVLNNCSATIDFAGIWE